MRRFFVGIVTLGLLATALGLAVAAIGEWIASPADYAYEAERRALELERARADLAREQAQRDALLPWVTAAQIAALLLGLSGAIVGGLVAIDVYRMRRRPLVRINDGGAVLPRVWVEESPDAGLLALEGYWEAAAIRAAVPLPAHTFAPHTVYQNRQEGYELPAPADAPQLPAPVPTLGQAVTQGLFRTPAYLPGFTRDGQPIRLPQDAARSLLCAGIGGSGKSTALAVNGLQELLVPFPGAPDPPIYFLVDGHAAKLAALSRKLTGLGHLVAGHATKPAEVERLLKEFTRICRRRLDGAPVRCKVVLIADEVSMMYEDAEWEPLRDLLNATFLFANMQARAVGGRALAGVHLVPAYAFGGKATIKRSFPARVGFQLDPGDGAILGLTPAQARSLLSQPPGHCILAAPGLAPVPAISMDLAPGDVELVLTAAGAQRTGQRLFPVVASGAPQSRPQVAPGAAPVAPAPEEEVPPPGAAPVAGTNAPAAPERPPLEITPETAEALRLFAEGTDLTTAIEQAFNVSRKNPNAYTPAYRAVQAAIRQGALVMGNPPTPTEETP